MKKLFVAILASLVMTSWAQVYVKPHVKRDGTFVQGHYRSGPNQSNADNYGTRGNYNPYTGKFGTRDDDE